MPWVYSTLSTTIGYRQYSETPRNAEGEVILGRLPRVIRVVHIRGGAGVANKRLETPFGVGTEVSDDDLAFLISHPTFQRHMQAGHMRIVGRKTDPEVVAADMKLRDDTGEPTADPKRGRSYPLTPQDFAASNAKEPTVGAPASA